MEVRDLLTAEEFRPVVLALFDDPWIKLQLQLMDRGLRPTPVALQVGEFTDDSGRRLIHDSQAEANDKAFDKWLRDQFLHRLAIGGIQASVYLPADAEAVQKGLWVAGCARCGFPMWAEPPQGGKPGARHCRACLDRAGRDKKRNQRGTDLSERLCLACGASFTPKRKDARCCSAKCRAKLSRQKPAAVVEAPPAPVSKPVKAPPKAVREFVASGAIDRAEVLRMEAMDQDTDPNNATTARHEATALELFAQKLRNPRQRWEFHGVEEDWLECRLHDALGEVESLESELAQAIKGRGIFTPAEVKQKINKALAEAAAYRSVAAWLQI